MRLGYGKDVLPNEEESKLKESGYNLGKGTMQIQFDQNVPEAEMKEILLRKAQINQGNHH